MNSIMVPDKPKGKSLSEFQADQNLDSCQNWSPSLSVYDIRSIMPKTRTILFSSIILVSVIHLVPEAFGQQGTNMTASSGIDWNTLCTDISQMNILYQSCSNLVNQNGTLTPAGETAIECIKNGLSLGLEALHHGVPLSSVIFGLGLLMQPTGCGDTVNMNSVESPNQFQFLTRALGVH
ncbi:MAG: hypothetical protein WB988_22810 [Candidatus Nitrosopolaris sp.]|jgi:hypothetical protein